MFLKNLHAIYVTALLLLSAVLNASFAADFLPVDEAFRFQHMQDGEETMLHFDIAPEYYLYKPRISVSVEGKTHALTFLQEAVPKHDPNYGDTEVFYIGADAFFTTPKTGGKAVVHYQGCAEAGLCYPPQTQEFVLPAVDAKLDTAAAAALDVASAADVSDAANQVAILAPSEQAVHDETLQAADQSLLNKLQHGSKWSALLLFLGMGVLTAFAGCSYPMFPILSKIIMGEGASISRRRAFSLSLAYVLPIACVYALIGLVAGFFGNNISSVLQTPWALSVVALILVFMALSMFGLFELQLPSAIASRLNNLSSKQKSGTYLGAIIMGTLSAFIVSACTVPPIVAALTLITQTGDVLLGTAAMFLFGLGLGLPLLLLGLSASWLLPKAGNWMQSVQRAMAILLIAAAIYIIGRFASDFIVHILWLGFCIVLGLALVFSRKRWLMLIGSIALITGGFLGHDWFGDVDAKPSEIAFINVDNPSALAATLNNGQASMVDFYADWCISCKHMQRDVFSQSEIAAKIGKLNAIKIDITTSSPALQQIMDQYQVIGAPAILFFDQHGNELRSLRVTGEMGAAEFGKRLDAVLAAK